MPAQVLRAFHHAPREALLEPTLDDVSLVEHPHSAQPCSERLVRTIEDEFFAVGRQLSKQKDACRTDMEQHLPACVIVARVYAFVHDNDVWVELKPTQPSGTYRSGTESLGLPLRTAKRCYPTQSFVQPT